MSGVRITELTNTTDIGNGDYVATDGTQGTRKISFNNLSGKTLDKLTDKTFSGLNTTAKTVTGAINELNTRVGNIITPSAEPSLSELVDIRTNFLGQTFSNAGDAVRISDMLARGFTFIDFSVRRDWRGDRESGVHNATASINVTDYKGGQICAIFNSDDNSNQISEGYALLIYGGDTSTPDTSAVDIGYPDYYYDIHAYTGDLSGNYRIGIIVNIPDDYEYTYLYVVYLPLNVAYPSASGIITPEFVAYGVGNRALTFTDPDSDGNIVIS